MDRCGIFIDAGYLFAAGGQLCGFGPSRSSVQIDGLRASEFFAKLARESCGLPPLRTYWYDGAKDGIPTRDHQSIAALPNVKLRLGRINAQNQQKGVDALIYRDLITLARERAISDAFLLAGDEDLREGVKAAQDMGVRVTLIGIETSTGGENQSRELQHEADEILQLDYSQLSGFLSSRLSPPDRQTGPDDPTSSVAAAATKYAARWAHEATREEVDSLLACYPRIPGHLDPSLLAHVEHTTKESLRQREFLRHTARGAFWDRIKAIARSSADET